LNSTLQFNLTASKLAFWAETLAVIWAPEFMVKSKIPTWPKIVAAYWLSHLCGPQNSASICGFLSETHKPKVQWPQTFAKMRSNPVTWPKQKWWPKNYLTWGFHVDYLQVGANLFTCRPRALLISYCRMRFTLLENIYTALAFLISHSSDLCHQ